MTGHQYGSFECFSFSKITTIYFEEVSFIFTGTHTQIGDDSIISCKLIVVYDCAVYTFHVLYSNKVGLLRNEEYVYGGFPEMIAQQEIFLQASESHYVQKPKDRLTEIHNLVDMVSHTF